MSRPLSAAEAASLHRDIDAGFLLPTKWYSDPTLFEAELEYIHRRAWHFAAHAGELANPGDVHVRKLAGVPIVLTRDAAGTVRGYINICRHRGHPVVLESGNQPKLHCRFHGWTYGHDGRLLHAPQGESDKTFDPAQFGLVPIQTRVWGPMIWANIDLAAPPFESWIEGMNEVILGHGLNVVDCAYGFECSWDIDANWKVFQDNTIECYHCPTAHPELARVLEMKPELQQMFIGSRTWIHHIIPFRPGFRGSLTTRPHEGRPFNYYYHWIFPSTYLQFAGRGFDIGSVDVIAPDRIRFRHICFMPKGTPQEILDQGTRQLASDATILQDVELCNAVQAGHASGRAPTNRVLGPPEFLLSHFQHLIVDMMADEQPLLKAAAE